MAPLNDLPSVSLLLFLGSNLLAVVSLSAVMYYQPKQHRSAYYMVLATVGLKLEIIRDERWLHSNGLPTLEWMWKGLRRDLAEHFLQLVLFNPQSFVLESSWIWPKFPLPHPALHLKGSNFRTQRWRMSQSKGYQFIQSTWQRSLLSIQNAIHV